MMGLRLVRDRSRPRADVPWLTYVTGDDFDRALIRKLGEEVGEFLSASCYEEQLEEAADVNEVLLAILRRSSSRPETPLDANEYHAAAIARTRQAKFRKNGGFEDGLVVDGYLLGSHVYDPLGGMLLETDPE
jgi:predicted house-cleaning noncanonical NTP pyrophosphatase (MazG superfamily)